MLLCCLIMVWSDIPILLELIYMKIGDIMTSMKSILIIACCLTVMITNISNVYAVDWEESPKVEDLFTRAAVNGTFVLYDVTTQKYVGYDKIRAETRYTPASTFKLPNSLIGLSTGAVTSVDELLPYKGDPNPIIKYWAKDMGLKEAIVVSNVPIYQELARRIGLIRMKEGIERLGYGNKQIGTTVDTFWLRGPLKISAIEQTQFLAKLAQGVLPLAKEVQYSVSNITLIEKGAGWELHGKTGWENAPGKGVGWWVGWVTKDNRVYAFALNMDIQKESDAGKRIELGKASLKALGVL